MSRRAQTWLLFAIFAFGLFVVVGVLSASGAMRNNADYARSTRCAGLLADQSHPVRDFRFSIVAREWLPCGVATPVTAALMVTRTVVGLGGGDAVTIAETATLFSCLWLIGLAAALRHSAARENLVPLLLTVALTAAYSGFFRSFYEEAAVLTLMPWLLLGVWRWRKEGSAGLLLAASIGVIGAKAQMLAAIPLLFLAARRPLSARRWPSSMAPLLLALALASFLRWEHSGLGVQNAYNRFYHGVGVALQGVADWPARTHSDRRRYFSRNREALQQRTAAYEPDPANWRLGTGFAPTGLALRADLAADPGKFSQIVEPGRLSVFLGWLAVRPELWPDLAYALASVSVTADYRLRYLEQWLAVPLLDRVRHALLNQMGAVAIGLAVIAALWRRRIAAPLFLATALPVAAWLGDGFYEFEKHMAAYWMLLPLIFLAPERR